MNRNISAIILIVISAGLYFTVTRGMLADANSIKDVNNQYVEALDHAEQLITLRDDITKQYNDISQADRTRLDRMIPSTVDNIRLIIDLNSLALKHGFSLNDVKANTDSSAKKTAGNQAFAASALNPSGPIGQAQQVNVSEPALDKVSVTFTAHTNYDQFIAFMQDLEAGLRIMDPTKFSVAVGDDGKYNFSAQLQTYWLRQ